MAVIVPRSLPDALRALADDDLHDLLKHLGFHMADRRDDAEDRGIGEEYVELSPALVDRTAKPVYARHVGKVERNQRRAAAGGFDFVIQLFKAALRSGNSNDVHPGNGQSLGKEIADAARCAGDQRHPSDEIDCHPLPASSDNCRTLSEPSRSINRVGYWPVKQASQNCGCALSRDGSSTAR